MSNKVPNYQIPERTIQMQNGEQWVFRFDNRALHAMDALYGGAPGSVEMLHCLSASQQHLDGKKLTFDEFLDIMPPMIDPTVKSRIDGLMNEVKAKQQAAQSGRGNENPQTETPSPLQPSESAGSDATTSAEPSSPG